MGIHKLIGEIGYDFVVEHVDIHAHPTTQAPAPPSGTSQSASATKHIRAPLLRQGLEAKVPIYQPKPAISTQTLQGVKDTREAVTSSRPSMHTRLHGPQCPRQAPFSQLQLLSTSKFYYYANPELLMCFSPNRQPPVHMFQCLTHQINVMWGL